MKPGDLIRYRGLDPCGKDSALGLCLKKEIDPGIPHLGKRMLVMWFDDYLATYEDPNDAIPVISGTVGDFTTIANVTPFVNYEWRNNCGCYTTT